jgi:hypothetical protein
MGKTQKGRANDKLTCDIFADFPPAIKASCATARLLDPQ